MPRHVSSRGSQEVCQKQVQRRHQPVLREYLFPPVRRIHKFAVFSLLQIDLLYKRVPLPDHYTLIDIAYIYSWQRVSYTPPLPPKQQLSNHT